MTADMAMNWVGFVFQRSYARPFLLWLAVLATILILTFVRAHLYLRGQLRPDLDPATSFERRQCLR
jgi:hypothetical protein